MRHDMLPRLYSARERARALLARYPEWANAASVFNQIEYLIALGEAAHDDRSRLKDIILGIQAAREVEDLDDDLATDMHEIAYQVHLELSGDAPAPEDE